MKKINVVIFARVSSKTSRQENKRQIQDLEALAKRNGWNVVKIITSKISASKTKRGERGDLVELFEAVRNEKICKVIVTEITRISRKAKDIKNIISDLHDLKCSVYIQSFGLDTLSKNKMMQFASNIVIDILAEFAELEAEFLSDRIKSGLRASNKKLGRPKTKMTAAEIVAKYPKVAKRLKKGFPLNQIANDKTLSVSKPTVIKVKKALAELEK